MANVLVQESSLQDIADAIRTKNGTQNTYKPAQMADAIEAISGGGITPTGTIQITANGTHNVTNYASAEVNVPTGSSPTGTKQISITENGTTTEDVSAYASAEITVNVPSSGISWDDLATDAVPNGDVHLTCTSIAKYGMGYKSTTNTWRVYAPNVTYVAESAFRGNDNLTEIHLPNLTTTHQTGYTFNLNPKLKLVDYGEAEAVRGNGFSQSPLFDTLILRKTDAITALNNVSAFNTTCFKSDGSGGTIYIPKVLYDHLGDGTALDYKAATNWSTVDGYGTITWAQIEGSAYEL